MFHLSAELKSLLRSIFADASDIEQKLNFNRLAVISVALARIRSVAYSCAVV
jgi:hypothetical protein